MKTWDEIDVKQVLSLEDFCMLFTDKLPLNEEEKASLVDYFKMYELFIKAELDPEKAWVTIRNIFAVKNQQLIERIKTSENLRIV
jgi:hypothetical protein